MRENWKPDRGGRERLGRALHRAPFAHPATVRGRVCGRIGPLVHWYLCVVACEHVAEHEPALARSLWARARIPRPSPIHPSSGRLSRQRSSRTGPLLSHAERAALAWRFAAKRWSIGRTAGRPSVTQASGSHRGRLCRPGAPLEGPHAEFQRIVRVAQSPTRPVSAVMIAG